MYDAMIGWGPLMVEEPEQQQAPPQHFTEILEDETGFRKPLLLAYYFPVLLMPLVGF